MTAVDEPSVWFSPPTNAVPIDLGDDPALRMSLLRGSGLPPAECEALVALQELLVGGLQEGGVTYAAHLVAGVGERLSVAMLCVMVRPVPLGNDDALDAIAAGVAGQADHRTVEALTLPCGRAQLFVEERVVDPLGDGSTHQVRQAQIVVPSPGRDLLATFALTTEFRHDWNGWMALLRKVAATITFDPPGARGAAPSSISAVLTA